MLFQLVRTSCLLLLSLVWLPLAAQDFAIKRGQVEVIPFKMRVGYPFVDIKIGQETYNLLVDMTDYRQITLSPEVLANVPHTVTGSDKYAGANDKVFFLKQFVLDEVALGDLHKLRIKGTEEAVDPKYPTPSPAGAIGAGMFFDDVLTLDFHNSQFIVNPGGALDRCEPLAALGLPLVTVARLNGKQYTFLLDIAYQYSVIDTHIAAALMNQQSRANNSQRELLIADLTFDNFDVLNTPFYPLSMEGSGLHGVIGMDVFRRYNLALDFNNNCFNLPLAKGKISNPLPLKIPEFR